MLAAPRRQRLRDRIEGVLDLLEEGGFQLWSVVSAGIWTWAFHILFLSAFAELACSAPVVVWIFHAATAVTALATVLAGWLCLALVRRYEDDESAGTVGGRTHFLGLFGFLTNAISVALILLEGAFVPFIDPCV